MNGSEGDLQDVWTGLLLPGCHGLQFSEQDITFSCIFIPYQLHREEGTIVACEERAVDFQHCESSGDGRLGGRVGIVGDLEKGGSKEGTRKWRGEESLKK